MHYYKKNSMILFPVLPPLGSLYTDMPTSLVVHMKAAK